MSKLQLSLTVCDYDRTRPILDGQVQIEGCETIPVALEPEEAFHRAFKYQEFDISELSLSSFTMLSSRGDAPYVGIPVFISRLFRHSSIYIRTDKGINSPEDLKGKTIGLPEYQITASVWLRGMLNDEYGVKPTDIKWRQGGIEEPGRTERAPLKLPDDIDLQPIPTDRTLSEMLESGELDAVLAPQAPSCFTNGAPNIARLFPDFKKAEQDYYRRTKIFPIMHIVGIRRSLVEKHPWLPISVYKAFLKAKEYCVAEQAQIGHLFTNLPWSVAEFYETRELMGEDFWSYGAEANRTELDTFFRYHYEDGLTQRLMTAEDIFAASTFELSKK